MQMYYELKQQKSKSTVSFLILHIILITLLHLVTSLLLVVLLALLPRMVSAPIAAGAAAALVPLAAFVVAFIIIICYMFVGHISGVGGLVEVKQVSLKYGRAADIQQSASQGVWTFSTGQAILLDLKLSSFERNLVIPELALLFRIHRQIKINSIKLLKVKSNITLERRLTVQEVCFVFLRRLRNVAKFEIRLVLRYWIYE
ncbi:Hypothetical_protein [Hexamita inflata]|uniref:Hypothetical_protein n=1 Tax=Hexamita inflata TaxID=28002 RepID=A0AA86N8D1_9EUKA|nr:Hypothetical protein HINF_LOCUS2592 [Hexamita inflata]